MALPLFTHFPGPSWLLAKMPAYYRQDIELFSRLFVFSEDSNEAREGCIRGEIDAMNTR